MGIARLIIGLAVSPHLLLAETGTFYCEGSDPVWTLELQESSASFAYLDRKSELEIPQRSNAEGADWPKAMTLIGPRDSAIVLLHSRACGTQTHEAQVLTQRGETPVLLTGCCLVEN